MSMHSICRSPFVYTKLLTRVHSEWHLLYILVFFIKTDLVWFGLVITAYLVFQRFSCAFPVCVSICIYNGHLKNFAQKIGHWHHEDFHEGSDISATQCYFFQYSHLDVYQILFILIFLHKCLEAVLYGGFLRSFPSVFHLKSWNDFILILRKIISSFLLMLDVENGTYLLFFCYIKIQNHFNFGKINEVNFYNFLRFVTRNPGN